MAFTAVTVTTGTLSDEAGNHCSGQIVFALTQPMTNGTVTAEPTQLTLTLSSGSGSITLYANDDAGTTPLGVQYIVLEQLVGLPEREYMITVPSGLGSTLQLSSLAPAQPGFE